MKPHSMHDNTFEGLASTIANLPWGEVQTNGSITPRNPQKPKERVDWVNDLVDMPTTGDKRAKLKAALLKVYAQMATSHGQNNASGKRDLAVVVDAFESIYQLDGVPADARKSRNSLSFWRYTYEKIGQRMVRDQREAYMAGQHSVVRFLMDAVDGDPTIGGDDLRDNALHKFGTPPAEDTALTITEAGY